MKFRKTGGLIGAGGVAQSFLSRMPALLAHVGPIKGASLHVSRRIANNLRAGTGVKDYSALAKCGIIFIAVPEDVLDKIAGELAAAVPLGGKPVVICDVLRNSQVPGPLHDSGARIATLNCIPGLEEKLFVAEGHAGVVTELERLLAHDQRKLIYAKPDAKSLYLSGIYIAEHLFLPWIAGAVDSLRAAGFTRAEATKVVRSLGWRALRAYEKAGPKAWNSGAAQAMHQFLSKETPSIRAKNRKLGIFYSEACSELLHYLSNEPERATKAKAHSAS